VSNTQIAFAYAGDIWVASRDGGDAKRLTSFPGTESNPHFSPDGKQIAFSMQYGGNTDVYVIDAAGGEARRLTCTPGRTSRALVARRETDLVQLRPRQRTVVGSNSSGRSPRPGGARAPANPRRAARLVFPDAQRLAYEKSRAGTSSGATTAADRRIP